MAKWRALVALGLFVAFCSPAISQVTPSFCAKVTPAFGPLGYQVRDNGQRCEGLYEPEIGAQPIELLNLTYSLALSSNAGRRCLLN